MTTTLELPSDQQLPPDHAGSSTVNDPRWTRPGLITLLVGTAALYLWNLSANGYANTFYSAAAQAGSQSWEAFLFGSSDAANVMTVDKPPVFLWPMGISVRIFGLSSWSILAPQVLLGVASVFLLYRAVRRGFGAAAGLISGLVLALTPVAALMFRFDNPDAMLTFLMVGAAWALIRALHEGRTKWLVITGVFMGFAFLTKDLAAFLILPALAVTYLVAGPVRLRRRLGQLGLAGLAMIVSAGWWVALVELLPASSRPYVGGSTDNSFLSLVLGANGLDRIVSGSTGTTGDGGPGGGGGFSQTAGALRLFTGESGAQIGWLLPTGLLLLVAGLVLRGKRPRTDPMRAALILWALWLVVSMAIYSFMSGTYHEYYNISIAPPAAALIGAGLVLAWRAREKTWVRWSLVAITVVTGGWSFVMLGRSAAFLPWLRWVVLGATGLGVVLLILIGTKALSRSMFVGLGILAAVVGLAGPTAYTVQTVNSAHTGSIPTAGPAVTGGTGGFGRMGGNRPPNAGQFAELAEGAGISPPTGNGGAPFGMGGPGSMSGDATPSAAVVALLHTDAGQYTWVAATTGATNAAQYQLATEDPVIGIGGFGGGGAAPTLAQFQSYVANSQIHYYIAGGQGGFGGFGGGGGNGYASTPASQIQAWVEANYASTELDGVTIYDLTAAPGSVGG